MTNKEASDVLDDYDVNFAGHTTEEIAEAFDVAFKALEQEPCEDVVSRQAVEKITWEEPSYSDALNVLTEVRDKVRALPSVTPTRKKGKWIYNEKDSDLDYLVYSCSVCGRHVHIYLTNNNRYIEDYPYCHCGAYMKGEKE